MNNVTHTTLIDLLAEIKSVVKNNFNKTYWIVSEVSELKVNSKSGHCYIDLIDKINGDIVAKIGAFIWSRSYSSIKQRFEAVTGANIVPGMKLLFNATVDYSEKFGLKLVIHDIDPAYTIGEMEQQRRVTLATLRKEGLIDRNKKLLLELPQTLAVISSSNAAGYEDFVHQIINNKYGYVFRCDLYQSVMQGTESSSSIIYALNEITYSEKHYDAIVIIRGGGSVADLNCFDNYDIARAVALADIPVITGIGHDKDRSIVDEVAHTSLKTPTAVAEFIIGRLKTYEDKLIVLQSNITTTALNALKLKTNRVSEIAHNIAHKANQKISLMYSDIAKMEAILKIIPSTTIEKIMAYLDNAYQQTVLLDPVNVLRRGYSITYLQGKVVKDVADVVTGDVLTTRLYSGNVNSVVRNLLKEE